MAQRPPALASREIAAPMGSVCMALAELVERAQQSGVSAAKIDQLTYRIGEDEQELTFAVEPVQRRCIVEVHAGDAALPRVRSAVRRLRADALLHRISRRALAIHRDGPGMPGGGGGRRQRTYAEELRARGLVPVEVEVRPPRDPLGR